MYGQVYLITNKINGKRYVGQTTRPLAERWREHVKERPTFPTAVNRAIRKYGRDNFSLETLVCCDTLEQLNKDEHLYILLLGTIGSHKGYNSKFGEGLGRMPDFVKAKIAKARSGQRRSLESRKRQGEATHGRKLTPEHRQHISEAQTGSKRSPEACRNIRTSKLGRKNPSYRGDVLTEILVSAWKNGQSFSEIARRVGMSRGGVKHRIRTVTG